MRAAAADVGVKRPGFAPKVVSAYIASMTGKPPTPSLIENDDICSLVQALAARLGTTEEFAVKTAVEAELKRHQAELTPREKLDALLARFPKPNPNGQPAEKAFYDELSGEFD